MVKWKITYETMDWKGKVHRRTDVMSDRKSNPPSEEKLMMADLAASGDGIDHLDYSGIKDYLGRSSWYNGVSRRLYKVESERYGNWKYGIYRGGKFAFGWINAELDEKEDAENV